MTPKKIIIALLLILVVAGGAIAGLFLIRERQEIEEQAAVPTGVAEASIFPTSGSFDVGDTFPISIYFNTANNPINAVAIQLVYPFSGATPEITVGNIEINSALLSSGTWTCPVQEIKEEGTKVNINIVCAENSAFGFSANSDTLLATMDLTVNRAPSVSPLTIRFDPSKSVITHKTTGEDILLVPQSEGSYAVSGAEIIEPTITVVPTDAPDVTVTVVPTTSITSTPTMTPTPTTTVAASPTEAPELPDAGVSYPTIIVIGFAILVIMGSLILAI